MEKNNGEEEVSIVELLEYFKKGVRTLFRGIGKGIMSLYRVLLYPVLVLYKHYIITLVVVVSAYVVGYIVDEYGGSSSVPLYHSYMTIRPNFETSQMIYSNIEGYNSLISKNKYAELANRLGIAKSEIENLVGMKISPLVKKQDIVKKYKKYVAQDTLVFNSIAFEDYASNATDYDYDTHTVKIITKEQSEDLNKKLEVSLFKEISNNENILKRQKVELENNYLKDSIIVNNLLEIKNIQEAYVKSASVRTEEELSDNSRVLINRGKDIKSTREVYLLRERTLLAKQLNENREQILRQSKIVNVLSGFTEEKQKGIILSIRYRLILYAVLLLFLVLSIPKVLKHINAEKEKALGT